LMHKEVRVTHVRQQDRLAAQCPTYLHLCTPPMPLQE
jgi:hypothetical protein